MFSLINQWNRRPFTAQGASSPARATQRSAMIDGCSILLMRFGAWDSFAHLVLKEIVSLLQPTGHSENISSPRIGYTRGGKLMVPHERNRAGSAIDTLSIRGTGQAAALSFASRHPSHGPGPSYLTIAGNRSSSGGITKNRRRLHYGKTCSSSNDNNGGGCSQGTRDGRAIHSKSGGSSTTTVARNISSVCEGALVTGGEATKSGSGSRASTPVPPRQKGGGTGDGCGGHEKPWIAHQRPKSSRPSPRRRTRLGSARSAGCNGSRKESTSFVGRGFEGGDGGDVVTIHVCDEARGITRDFFCQRRLLLRDMKYFQSYLVKASSVHDEIDILVYCDVHIFEWLFEYMHHKSSTKKTKPPHPGNGSADDVIESNALGGLDESRGDRSDGGEINGKEAGITMPPALEVSTVVSILISSDFLQMKRLVDECLAFMGGNLTEILKLPIDLSCLSDKILVQLAKTVTLEQLAIAKDRKDKLLNRVYKKRIELDFRDISNAIHCCRHCTCLFSEKIRAVMNCRSAPPKVDFRGRLVRRHEALSPWSLSRTVTSLHRKGMSWTAVYWFLWGLTQPLFCVECGEVFLAGDVAECHYHPQEACFPREEGASSSGGNWEAAGAGTESVLGYYPCCRKPAYRFGLESEALGCATNDHVIEEENEDSGVLAMLKLQRANITYQAWRHAVREETRMALESVLEGGGKGEDAGAGPLGNGSGSGNTREGGMGGGGAETLKSGGISIVRDKMSIKRQPSAGRRPTRGQPGVPESPRNPTNNAAANKPMNCDSRIGGFRSSGVNTDSSNRGCDGSGARSDGFSTARAEPSGTRGVLGYDDDSRCGGGRRGGLGSRSRGKTLGQIWEVEASDALTAREKGLLPNEHPVQTISVENCRVEWGAFPRESSCLGEGQLRRWQTDSLRESDGLRMEKMCDGLRRRRRGKAGGSDKGGKPR